MTRKMIAPTLSVRFSEEKKARLEIEAAKRNLSTSELLRLAFDYFIEKDDRLAAELKIEMAQIKETIEKQSSALISMRLRFAELNVGSLPTALLGIQERLEKLYREDLNSRQGRDVQLQVSNEILEQLTTITDLLKEPA